MSLITNVIRIGFIRFSPGKFIFEISVRTIVGKKTIYCINNLLTGRICHKHIILGIITGYPPAFACKENLGGGGICPDINQTDNTVSAVQGGLGAS